MCQSAVSCSSRHQGRVELTSVRTGCRAGACVVRRLHDPSGCSQRRAGLGVRPAHTILALVSMAVSQAAACDRNLKIAFENAIPNSQKPICFAQVIATECLMDGEIRKYLISDASKDNRHKPITSLGMTKIAKTYTILSCINLLRKQQATISSSNFPTFRCPCCNTNSVLTINKHLCRGMNIDGRRLPEILDQEGEVNLCPSISLKGEMLPVGNLYGQPRSFISVERSFCGDCLIQGGVSGSLCCGKLSRHKNFLTSINFDLLTDHSSLPSCNVALKQSDDRASDSQNFSGVIEVIVVMTFILIGMFEFMLWLMSLRDKRRGPIGLVCDISSPPDQRSQRQSSDDS